MCRYLSWLQYGNVAIFLDDRLDLCNDSQVPIKTEYPLDKGIHFEDIIYYMCLSDKLWPLKEQLQIKSCYPTVVSTKAHYMMRTKFLELFKSPFTMWLFTNHILPGIVSKI